MIFVFVASYGWATCGGGGGGGMGGMGSGMSTQTYPVPWQLAKSLEPTMKEGLVVYWFPTGDQEFKNSSLRQSRMLSLYSQQCVEMLVADYTGPLGQK